MEGIRLSTTTAKNQRRITYFYAGGRIATKTFMAILTVVTAVTAVTISTNSHPLHLQTRAKSPRLTEMAYLKTWFWSDFQSVLAFA